MYIISILPTLMETYISQFWQILAVYPKNKEKMKKPLLFIHSALRAFCSFAFSNYEI